MKAVILSFLFGTLVHSVQAQTESPVKDYRNFPIVISLQFHALSMPFRDIRTNFKNIGIGIGTEVSLNGNHDWVQQFQAIWFPNKSVGNGLMFYTQFAWRPYLASDAFAELKAGAGYLIASRPVDSFRWTNNQWQPVGRKGKGMLVLPVGVSLGYNSYSADVYLAPFISYQFMLLKGYNASVPLVPETLIQAGARLHPVW